MRTLTTVSAGLLGLAISTGVNAATLFSDRSTFEAAGGGTTTLGTFESGTNDFGAGTVTGQASNQTAGTVGQNGNVNGSNRLQFRLVTVSFGFATFEATSPLALLGFDLRPYFGAIENDGGETVAYITDTGENGTFRLSDTNTVSFLGFRFDAPVTTLRFDAVGGGGDQQTWFGIDDVRTYSALATAVPEPASWAMMIGGFGLVGGALRRRRQQARTNVSFA